jgi:two-component system cell cycle sensor histidine kinase/response regulator CckA
VTIDWVIFGSKRANVLVVEDDYLVCEILCAILEELGLEVATAHDAGSALAVLSVAPVPFGLAIVDLRLPGVMGGAELARQIRASGTAVIMMSADHESLDAAHQSDRTLVCLEKPFTSDTLQDRIERTLTGVGCGV